MKGKMAIIGNGDSVLVFKSAGMDAFCAEEKESARHLLKDLAKEYQVIFLTDVLAKDMEDTLSEYAAKTYPIILTLPSMNGSNGYGYEQLKKQSERALGIDILFQEKNDN